MGELIIKSNEALTISFSVILLVLLSTVLVFPVSASGDFWMKKAPMITARAGLGVAVVDRKIYAIGGVADNSTFLRTNEQYNPETDTWITKMSMPTARAFFCYSCLSKQNLRNWGTDNK